MNNKKKYLDYLHYKIDKQKNNLELAFASKNSNGDVIWSKWINYLDAQSDKYFLSKVNNRTILPNEVVIDLEEPERFSEVIKKINEDFDDFLAYKTGSKGYHIHLFFKYEIPIKTKLNIIKRYGADEQKAIKRCMIALENCPHWKTGNIKEIINYIK
jgi:hypothetical protein